MADDHGDQEQKSTNSDENSSKKLDQSNYVDNYETNQSKIIASNNIENSLQSTSSNDNETKLITSKPSTSSTANFITNNHNHQIVGLIDPSELQSTSRSSVNLHHHHHNIDISPGSSSSKSSPIRLESSTNNNKNKLDIKRQKIWQNKTSSNKNSKIKNLILSTTTTNNANDILEIERINIEDDINDNNHRHSHNYHQHRHSLGGNDDDDDDDDDENNDIQQLNAPLDHSNRSASSNNIDYLLSLLPPSELNEMPYEDPIQIRGNGNITLFGLSNCYTSTFPSALLGRVSKEEFEYTINRINHLLQQQHSTNAKFLLLGCLCCCFSLGCSLLWPTFALSRRTKNSLEKLLAMENSRLYNKLGLNWRLSKQPSHTNHSFMEYILVIDFLPKMHIYQPD